MKIISIIVTYNGEKWIQKCLQSLEASSIPTDIFIVDNCSNDNTISIIEENFPYARIEKSNANLGFGKANNLAIRESMKNRFDYIFLLNQDAIIQPNTIEKLVSVQKSDKHYGILSPIQLDGSGNELETAFLNFLVRSNSTNFFSDSILNKSENQIYKVEFVNAASWLISYECIKKVGGFDPIFYMYGEDNDYINRIRYHGFKLGIYPSSFICHDTNPKNKKSLERNLIRRNTKNLYLLKNINQAFYVNLFSVLKSNTKSLIKGIIYFDLGLIAISIKLTFNILSKIFKIIKHRELSKNNGSFL